MKGNLWILLGWILGLFVVGENLSRRVSRRCSSGRLLLLLILLEREQQILRKLDRFVLFGLSKKK